MRDKFFCVEKDDKKTIPHLVTDDWQGLSATAVSTATSATVTATTTVATTEAATVVVTPFLVVTALSVDLTAKHIQTITHMEHGIRVDAVVTRLSAAVGIHPAAEVRLLAQEVVEVQGHDERLVSQERLRHLTVPDQLVGVLRRVAVTTT